MSTTQDQRVDDATRQAFCRPAGLTPEAWDGLISKASEEADLFGAILAAQAHLALGGRNEVRALALTAFNRRDWRALIQAGRTEGAITNVYAMCVAAGLTV